MQLTWALPSHNFEANILVAKKLSGVWRRKKLACVGFAYKLPTQKITNVNFSGGLALDRK